MLAKNLDWELFVKLDDAGLNDTAIGKAMGVNPMTGKPWNGNTVKRWRARRREERVLPPGTHKVPNLNLPKLPPIQNPNKNHLMAVNRPKGTKI